MADQIELPTVDEVDALDGAELDAVLARLNEAARRIEAATVAVVERCERTGHYATDGHRNVSAWQRAVTNCTPGDARTRTRTARVLRQLPAVTDAFAAGRVGVAQVRELARLGANPRCGDQLADSEAVLLDAAQTLEYPDFRVVTARWEQLADQDGAHRDHERVHAERNARCSFDGAMFRFETVHGVIQGTSMRNVFDAFERAEFDRDWQWVRDTHGADARAALLPRTAAQRRADAFTAMVLAAADAGTGDGRRIDATVNLICDLEQFEHHLIHQLPTDGTDRTDTDAEPGVDATHPHDAQLDLEPDAEPGVDARPADTGLDVGTEAADNTDATITDPGRGIDPATVRGRRCETTDGHPVDPHQLVAAAIVGRIRHIIVDGAGIIVAAGRTRQLFTGALRDAIRAIDPVCGWLGCNLRAQLADIDHLRPRSRGGPTDAGNGKIMCRKHNLFKHTADYTIERQPDGTITITRPDGTRLRPPDAA